MFNKKYLIIIPVLLAIVVGLSFYIRKSPSSKNFLDTSSQNIQGLKDKKTVIVAGKLLFVEIADTTALQTKGLSGHISLKDDEGMLFIFPDSQIRNFWMKEMLFPIDIIWIDKDGKIVDIEYNAEIPEEGTPDYKLPIYTSSSPVTYVLEVNAGFSQKLGVKPGDTVQIK